MSRENVQSICWSCSSATRLLHLLVHLSPDHKIALYTCMSGCDFNTHNIELATTGYKTHIHSWWFFNKLGGQLQNCRSTKYPIDLRLPSWPMRLKTSILQILGCQNCPKIGHMPVLPVSSYLPICTMIITRICETLHLKKAQERYIFEVCGRVYTVIPEMNARLK